MSTHTNRKLTATALASLLMVITLGAGAADGWSLPGWLNKDKPAATATATASTGTTTNAPPVLPAAQVPNYRAIVQTQGPAVVGVTVAGLRQASDDAGNDAAPSADDPFFRFFRGVPGLRMPPQGAQPFRGQGSGFIVSADGLVLTNAHVVRDARQVTVKLSDRREFSAKVLGSDPATDIAVLKIDATGLPTVALGDPQRAQVGDWVLAIGAPYGFEQTASQGIVSAKGRSLPGENVVPFIQTDAAINPGNSGGPLFDAEGRVIGVNAQIYSRSGGFQGLAFSIPIDVAMQVKDQIVKTGKVEHARLGVTLQDLSAPLAASFGLKAPDGALVASVMPGSAADKAGLKAGDVITAVDGRPVQVAGDVSTRVGMARPGDRMKLALWRDKAGEDLSVTLGRAEPDRDSAAAAPEHGALGLAIRPLDRQELKRAGLDHGLLIEQVSGPSQLAGIEPGDVLLALNGKPVDRLEQVQAVLKQHPRQVALLVVRDGQQLFVPVQLG
ncbi:Do family serine endopeptidase [Leptothrix sp. BB-4]